LHLQQEREIQNPVIRTYIYHKQCKTRYFGKVHLIYLFNSSYYLKESSRKKKKNKKIKGRNKKNEKSIQNMILKKTICGILLSYPCLD